MRFPREVQLIHRPDLLGPKERGYRKVIHIVSIKQSANRREDEIAPRFAHSNAELMSKNVVLKFAQVASIGNAELCQSRSFGRHQNEPDWGLTGPIFMSRIDTFVLL